MEKKIYPSVEELTTINSMVRCTEEGCNSIFSSESNLTLHLAKTHKKEHLMKTDNVNKQYYCPEVTCIYSNAKFFKKLKLLKQHYLKVHGEKSFVCDSCSKGFPTQSAKNSHSVYCGVIFKCNECEAAYSSYETLITHARRKKHTIFDKTAYKLNSVELPKEVSSSSPQGSNRHKNQFILPKGSVSLQLFVKADKDTSEKSNQTDLCLDENMAAVGRRALVNHSASQTQGWPIQRCQSSAETQTVGDYISKKLTDLGSCSDDSLSRKSIKTQTKPVSSTSKSCNTSFNLSDFDFNYDIKVERNSSGTQTVTSVPTELIYSTTIDPPKDLEFGMDPLDTESFFNCNTETQTDFIFDNDLLSPDYYSHMYTQTCDDIYMLNDLGFSNTHTQTVFDDMLRSVESQTTMSQGSRPLMSCRDMANMETQTDIEFKQILEEINA